MTLNTKYTVLSLYRISVSIEQDHNISLTFSGNLGFSMLPLTKRLLLGARWSFLLYAFLTSLYCFGFECAIVRFKIIISQINNSIVLYGQNNTVLYLLIMSTLSKILFQKITFPCYRQSLSKIERNTVIRKSP